MPGLGLLAVVLADLLTNGDHSLRSTALVGLAAVLAVLVIVEVVLMSRALARARSQFVREHRRLERAFMDAPIAITINDREGRWLSVNPAWCRMLGFPEHKLLGRSFAEFTHPDDLDDSMRRWIPLRDGIESSEQYEKRYVGRDGRVIWALVTASRISDWDEEDFMIVQIQDITTRKHTEVAFAEERQLLTAFLESTPDQVYFKDLASRFLRVSNVQAAKLGFASADAAIGRSDFDAFSDQHAHKAFEDEQRIIRTGKPIVNVEERETFIDGREAWVSTTKMPLRDATGAVVGTFGVSSDITARKHAERALLDSEERWRTLLANSQEMVMLVAEDARFTYTSPSVKRWLGYGAADLLGSKLTSWCDPDDQEALAKAFRECCGPARASGRPVSVSHRAAHKDGSWHALETTLVCLLDDPAIGAILISARDVTERATLERERERLELQRRVSQRLEAVGQLSAGIAHEINTPLQFVGDSVTFLQEAVDELLALTNIYHSLMHTTELINKEERRRRAVEAEEQADLEYLTERIPQAFTRTVEGIGRVRSIVQAMRRFSHASGTETSPSDLNEALDTTLAVCRNEYKYVADIELELSDLPLVTCNVGELNQVFLNLIINAAQAIAGKVAGADERGTIRISTVRDGAEVVIRIADDGPGIPVELQDRIYEPFFTTKEIGKGSGQGLALARTTVQQHSGSIECTSAPGAGTTFTIRLPIEPPARSVARAA